MRINISNLIEKYLNSHKGFSMKSKRNLKAIFIDGRIRDLNFRANIMLGYSDISIIISS